MNVSFAPTDSGPHDAGPQTLLETLDFPAGNEGTRPNVAPQVEDAIAEQFGRYRVKKLLGQGGMGAVYLAEDTQLGRDVALKIPRNTKKEDWTSPLRFLREARAVATLQHPNICPLYDVGEQDGVLFMAMAYIEGQPLNTYINAAHPQSAKEAATVVRKIALALAEAHRRGIIHRDLKPANIMIDHRGEPIVMDFGLACRLDVDVETKLTQDGTIVGTPAYMAPEQFSNHTAGPASDIYSLAVVMYELVSGKCPFSGSIVSVIGQVLHWIPTPLAAERTDVPAPFSEICRRAMEKNPADRFASMDAFAAALTAFLEEDSATTSSTSIGKVASTEHDDLGWVKQNWAVLAAASAMGMAGGLIWAMSVASSAGSRSLDLTPAAIVLGENAAEEFETSAEADVEEDEPFVVPEETPEKKPAKTPTAQPTPAPPVNQPVVVRKPSPAVAVAPTLPATIVQFVPQPRVATPAPPPPEEELTEFGPQFQAVMPTDMRGVNELFKKADFNNDNRLDGGELFLHIVHRVDVNDDELVTRDELLNAYRKQGAVIFDFPGPGRGPPPPHRGPPPRRPR